MRYTLIPLTDTALSLDVMVGACAPDELSDGERDALARAFERTLQTCELLITYAVGIAGKPSS